MKGTLKTNSDHNESDEDEHGDDMYTSVDPVNSGELRKCLLATK